MTTSDRDPLIVATEIEATLRSEGVFENTDFRRYLLPAAVIGYYPGGILQSCEQKLRPLFEELASRCTGLWVGLIANHYGVDPNALKQLWRLADEDREAEIVRRVRRLADRTLALAQLRQTLEADYLGADLAYYESFADVLNEAEYLGVKQTFVRNWLRANLQIPPDQFPDEEQIAAIAAATGTVQVTARAGSGKTTTLVRRAYFLIQHCRVHPGKILLLAFNRSAALGIRHELLKLLCPSAEATVARELRSARGAPRSRIDLEVAAVDRAVASHQVALPCVLTFHALAYGLVNPEQSLLMDAPDGGELGLSRAMQDVIDGQLRLPASRADIRSLMLTHFRHDWDRIEHGGFDKDRGELIAHRRLLPRESLQGEYVKSFGEKLIADFLLEHGIPYRYERNHRWGGFNYRPDFTLFRQTGRDASGVIIEYFGLAGDPDYDEAAERKRAYWAEKPNWDFLEFTPSDIVSRGAEGFLATLKEALVRQGFRCSRLSEDEIWALVKNRAIDRFTRAVTAFVGRCRKHLFTPAELESRFHSHETISEAESRFLPLAQSFYEEYLETLRMYDQDDFDGVLQRAIDAISKGQTRVSRGQQVILDVSKVQFLSVDEFQDFSELFYRLVHAVRQSSHAMSCFCVGDDWQAINGFAGSDLKYFENFPDYMGPSAQLSISVNYRSSRAVVDAGNAVMEGHGVPARCKKNPPTGAVLLASMDEYDASLIEQKRHAGDDITPAILRVISRSIADGRQIVMLSRTNSIPWYVNWESAPVSAPGKLQGYLELIRALLPEDSRSQVSISTAHKYKGLEKDDVIILDAVARSYPLVHPDWVFSRILGVTIEQLIAEERRLFYVALTRAKGSVFLFAEGRAESPFLTELKRRIPLTQLRWQDYPPVSLTSEHYVVRVTNRPGCRVANDSGGFDLPTYTIREALKVSGFRFRSGEKKAWERTIPSRGFLVGNLLSELWAQQATGVDVVVLDGANHVVGAWTLHEGVLVPRAGMSSVP